MEKNAFASITELQLVDDALVKQVSEAIDAAAGTWQSSLEALNASREAMMRDHDAFEQAMQDIRKRKYF